MNTRHTIFCKTLARLVLPILMTLSQSCAQKDLRDRFEHAHPSHSFSSDARKDAAIRWQAQYITEIGLQRTQCIFGGCPSYWVLFRKDGSVYYRGDDDARLAGIHKARIPTDRFYKLALAALELRFFELGDFFSSGVTDQATTYTLVKNDSIEKIVKDYGSGGPATLLALNHLVDATLESVDWRDLSKIELLSRKVGSTIIHSLECDQEPLESVFSRLSQICNGKVKIRVDLPDVYKKIPVTFKVTNGQLKSVLWDICAITHTDYTIEEDEVVIITSWPRPKSPVHH